MADQDTQTQRFEKWVRRRSPIVLLLLAAALTAAVFEVAAGVDYVNGRVRDRWFWRGAEYHRLNKLEAGMTASRFVAVLGEPVFLRNSPNRRFREYSFRRRGYWVQAVADREGTVKMFSVTSCADNFQPTFSFLNTKVRLQRTTFSAASRSFDPIPVVYHGLTATGNVNYFDVLYAGNPGNYKTFAWGLNDACPDWPEQTRNDRSLGFEFSGASDVDDPAIQRFRRTHTVNTYAETDVDANIWTIASQFQIGADRLLTRTLNRSVGGKLASSGKAVYPAGRHHFDADATAQCVVTVFSFDALRYGVRPALFNLRPSNYDYFVEGFLVVRRPPRNESSLGLPNRLPRYAEVAFLLGGEDSAVLARRLRHAGLSAWRRRNAVIVLPRPTPGEVQDAGGRRTAVPYMRSQEVRTLSSCLRPAEHVR